MNQPGPLTATLTACADRLVRRIRGAVPEALAVYAYGSGVRGATHSESDLDLALLLPPARQISAERLFELAAELEAIAGCRVDLSLLDRSRSVIHCKEVAVGGILLFQAAALPVAEFEMQTLSDYAHLSEDRAPVVEAYALAPRDE